MQEVKAYYKASNETAEKMRKVLGLESDMIWAAYVKKWRNTTGMGSYDYASWSASCVWRHLTEFSCQLTSSKLAQCSRTGGKTKHWQHTPNAVAI